MPGRDGIALLAELRQLPAALALNAVYFVFGYAAFAYFLQSARVHGTLVQMGE